MQTASEIIYALCAKFGLTAEHAAQIIITLDDAGYKIVCKDETEQMLDRIKALKV